MPRGSIERTHARRSIPEWRQFLVKDEALAMFELATRQKADHAALRRELNEGYALLEQGKG